MLTPLDVWLVWSLSFLFVVIIVGYTLDNYEERYKVQVRVSIVR